MGESSISNIGGSRRQGYHNPVDSILMQDRPMSIDYSPTTPRFDGPRQFNTRLRSYLDMQISHKI